jgi:hypothetical protein
MKKLFQIFQSNPHTDENQVKDSVEELEFEDPNNNEKGLVG